MLEYEQTTQGLQPNEIIDSLLKEKSCFKDEDEDEVTSAKCQKRKIRRLCGSDSESDKENAKCESPTSSYVKNDEDDTDCSEGSQSRRSTKASRIRLLSVNSDSNESPNSNSSQSSTIQPVPKRPSRHEKKRNDLVNKFDGLLSSRSEFGMPKNIEKGSKVYSHSSSEESQSEDASLEIIKKKIKERTLHLKSTIYDPDTSDEESVPQPISCKKKKQVKSVKSNSEKPIRMSAKEAMDNMQKIKSESNRMLREKEVSLPYHKPKALKLQEIMSKRKPALSCDGKALPIKMNEEQLKQYALQLEQRQKEVMELCKSDTDEENSKDYEVGIFDKQKDVNEKLDESAKLDAINTESLIEKNILQINTEDNNDTLFSEVQSECSNNSRNVLDDDYEKIVVPQNYEFSMTYTEQEHYEDITEDQENINTSKHEVVTTRINETALPINSEQTTKVHSEPESQLISLHYDSEINNTKELEKLEEEKLSQDKDLHNNTSFDKCNISDEDVTTAEINSIKESAELKKDTNVAKDVNESPLLIKDSHSLITRPKLTGTPGMVIDLDGTDPIAPRKLTGVELLKQRFTFFATLRTPEEKERDITNKIKPGSLHLKLKQELEDKIAEQRSLEWEKRLEQEKRYHEMNVDHDDNDIEKAEAKLHEIEGDVSEVTSSEEEEEEEDENLCEVKDKPRKRNPLIADEAEETDDETCEFDETVAENDNNESSNDESDTESSESEVEPDVKLKKGRILKAFEDSDEDTDFCDIKIDFSAAKKKINTDSQVKESMIGEISETTYFKTSNCSYTDTQDEDLQLAQPHKSFSEDLFTSQDSTLTISNTVDKAKCPANISSEEVFETQTFSISNANATVVCGENLDNFDSENVNILSETQLESQPSLDAVVGMCSGGFTQNLDQSQPVVGSQSQELGEDILALCTGKFYDNQFVTQEEKDKEREEEINKSSVKENEDQVLTKNKNDSEKINKENNLLMSIIDELDDPEFDKPKENKYFCAENTQEQEASGQFKKKFVIESEDENDGGPVVENKKKKKVKRKKLEQRALHISDDEDEETELEEEYESEIEEEDSARAVEYDSEENEVEVKPEAPKKKRKMAEFFENEAELTSEDEWVGSGDEDERGLDRMEREEGDDDTFNQHELRDQLGQIHMRDVLDQDKRVVRLIQELLFEDGDLGDGHRQRKFRWRNADGEEETGAMPGEFDTQEEEQESEEQWRKQRHEREVFLREMRDRDLEEESLTIKIETNVTTTTCESSELNTLSEKTKANKDVPSPVKSFLMHKQSYHNSLLSRGKGTLARLAALASPLVADEEAVVRVTSSGTRNMVFTTVSKDEPLDEPKKSKRKADANVDTPKLVKKMRIDEKKIKKNSLLDHIHV